MRVASRTASVVTITVLLAAGLLAGCGGGKDTEAKVAADTLKALT